MLNDKMIRKLFSKRNIILIKEKEMKKVKSITLQEDNKINYEYKNIKKSSKRHWIIFISVFLISSISLILRSQGLTDLFKTPIELSVGIVLATIFTEFSIAQVLFNSNIKNKYIKIMNITILGIIQLSLFAFSFVLEFSALSDRMLVSQNQNKPDVLIIDNYKKQVQDKDNLINQYRNQINLIPDDRLSLKKSMLNKIDKISTEKTEIQNKITDSLIKDKNKITDKSSIDNTSGLLNVNPNLLMKYIIIGIASMLNILYFVLMSSGIIEYKHSKED